MLSRIPPSQQAVVMRFLRWQDRHAALYGKLLLIKAMEDAGHTDAIGKLERTSYGRPFIAGAPDFNISHSGIHVACAIATHGKVGVDIEAPSDIMLDDFRKFIRGEEWDAIQCADDKMKCFFDLWTAKESVIKADGRGLSLPLTSIVISNDKAAADNVEYYLTRLSFDGAPACVASNVQQEVAVREIEKL